MLQNITIQISMELWGAILSVMFASFILIGGERTSKRGNLLMVLLFEVFLILISDSVAWATRGAEGTAAYYAVRISNFLVFALNYGIGYVAMLYLEAIMGQHNQKLSIYFRLPIICLCLLGFIMVTVSQFTGFLYYIDEYNIYHRAGGYLSICIVAGAMVVLIGAATAYQSYKLRTAKTLPLLLVFILMILATVIQSLSYGISLVNIAIVVGVVVMFFAYERERVALISEQKTKLLENDLRLAQREAELARKDVEMATINAQLVEQRTQIMLSQIQPHFLYNVLSAISSLCLSNPMLAKDTVDNFAMYLRANLNSLRNKHLVPFTEELRHTKAYLAIEQTRFGDDLSVVYDIQCDDFSLPSLSVQPMVENAVRHGICGSEDGGTVTIRTERIGGNIVITIHDDGVGFDMNVKPNDGRSHVGIENVAQRVHTLCGGNLTVESAPGRGTTAVITLPENSN